MEDNDDISSFDAMDELETDGHWVYQQQLFWVTQYLVVQELIEETSYADK